MEKYEQWITLFAVAAICITICMFFSLMVLIAIRQKLDDMADNITKIKQNTEQKDTKKKPLNIHTLKEKPTTVAYCPNCNELLFGEKVACDKCGQLLDWDNSES